MISPSLHVSFPLTMRLLRRMVLVGALFILLIAGARAWWEYRAALEASQQLMAGVEQSMSAPLAGSLRNFNAEQIEVQLEGIRSTPSISYAAVLEGGRVLVESGVPKDADVLERTTPLNFREAGGVRTLGELTLQVDLAHVRGLALNAAIVSLGFNSVMVALLCLALFLITRGMVSRHLAAAARHFGSLDLSGEEMRLPELRFARKWAGDELDILCLAVNSMQENLSATYAKARMAEQEARNQARFPQENPNPVLRVSAEGVLTSANQASDGFLAHVNCTLGQHLPKTYDALLREGFATGQVQRFETEYGGRTYAFAAVPVLAEGYMNLYGMDITERKQASDLIARSLEEKEILLKEIHHRVKNNMQVISSLLFLQMEHVSNPDDRALFAESQKRIQAMALVHEELYGSKDLSSVGMREYVTRLVERVLAGADIPVSTEFELDEVRLPVTRSIPCGLALNELVMNAVKHGFRPVPGRAVEGRLRVSLRSMGGEAVLEVEDNGPGLPPDFAVEASPTLGMTLVASLVKQLSGELTAQNTPGGGALFRLRFALETL